MSQNTKIYYAYRNRLGNVQLNQAIVNGNITDDLKETILASLKDDKLFIPSLVGLPEHRVPEEEKDRTIWFEFDNDNFELTDEEATVNISIEELAKSFKRMQSQADNGTYWEDTYKLRNILHVDEEKMQKAMECLADNGVDEDECDAVMQALFYILFNLEAFPGL